MLYESECLEPVRAFLILPSALMASDLFLYNIRSTFWGLSLIKSLIALSADIFFISISCCHASEETNISLSSLNECSLTIYLPSLTDSFKFAKSLKGTLTNSLSLVTRSPIIMLASLSIRFTAIATTLCSLP